MKEKKHYTAGEFAKKAGVTIRTIRFYDNKGILKPSSLSSSGYRLYTDEDFAKLQRILTLKYLGFTLEDIYFTVSEDTDSKDLKRSLNMQLQIVRNKREHLNMIETSILEADKMLQEKNELDWSKIINIIHILNMEKDVVEQYKDSSNLKTRINLHERFGVNECGWFKWIYDKLDISLGESILEIGCGNGELWKSNCSKIPSRVSLNITDISKGMINDAENNLIGLGVKAKFNVADCEKLPYKADTFDKVVANHMLFYVKDIDEALSEISRVLKTGGKLYCSTYGLNHMKEVEELAKKFDSRMVLSEINLQDIFGLENGKAHLMPWFNAIEKLNYEDYLIIDDYKPLLDYILSCHGNQHIILKDRYEEFENFIRMKVDKSGNLKITKNAGMFICTKI